MTKVWLGAAWPHRGPVAEMVRTWWDQGLLDGLELTVEHAFPETLDPSFVAGLSEAAHRGRLVGHAVMPSPYTPPDAIHDQWLERARPVVDRFPPRWLTDHEGLSRGDGWQAAPLPLPASRPLVRRVRDHLARVADALEVPTGLENLALAVSPDDARARPDLLFAMLEPDGVLLLDVHNLWCTAVNQGLDPVAYLHCFPLHLVRQLHVAGGRADPDGFRRDTHDAPVPEQVFALVDEALSACPHLEAVVWERLTAGDPKALVGEVRRLRRQIDAVQPRPTTTRGELPTLPDATVDTDAFLAAVRAGRRDDLEAVAPGFVTDPRAWRVMAEVTERWGRPTPR